jgi:DNA-binding Lrp family transcriptional regulator
MELLTMTAAELDRLRTLERIADGALTQVQAARLLELSERQVRRLMRRLEGDGARCVLSKRRGVRPNNRRDDTLRNAVLERYRSSYHGFGPTLLGQTLAERDDIVVSREWLRALLIANGLWKPRQRRRSIHPLRERRPCFGELVQMDGSPHHWFEERGPRSTLLLAIDDATSNVTAGRFDPAETSDGYFLLLKAHLMAYGRFGAAYTDKHSIFRYSGTGTDTTIVTQLQRALDELEIELICANSPQAKGRIERANRTFQDRLIKAMRLEQIATIEAANAFLPSFIADHNRRFAIPAAMPEDAHRSIVGFDLETILCRHDERVITKNLMFQIDDVCFKLTDPHSLRHLRAGSRIAVQRHPDGRITVHHHGLELAFEQAGRLARNAPIVGAKDLNVHLNRRIPDPRKVRTPAPKHPWRTPGLPPRQAAPDISALQKPDIIALR